jgi:phage protein D
VIATDTYVPTFAATLNGSPLPAGLRAQVLGVRFEEALEGAARVELQLANPALSLLEREQAEIGMGLELSLGYQSTTLEKVFSGEVTGIEAAFPSDGMPTLTLTALDATYRMSKGTKQRGFPWQLSDAVIATIVAAENQLLATPDVAADIITGLGVLQQKPRYQYKQSDHAFLRAIAREYGFDMWVDGNQLNFRLLIRALPAPQITLRWGESLLDFSPRLSDIGQIAAIRVALWIEALRTQLSVEVGWDGSRLTTRVMPAAFAKLSEPLAATFTIPDMPSDGAIDALRWAVGELRGRLNSRITASGSAIGDPRFRIGRVIAVDGIGPRFSADTYRLTSVAHTLDANGYRTRFQARLEVV